jgi:sugar fermentation stimulation protein A
MLFQSPLIEAQFLKRYKRFMADVRLDDGSIITVHCPNTGSMLGINLPGARCLISDSHNPTRQYRFTLEAVKVGAQWVGAHPARANTTGKEALEAGVVEGIGKIKSVRPEVKYGVNSRADLLLLLEDDSHVFVEIKSASIADGPISMFPDAVTSRGFKHLLELLSVVEQGSRALLLFVATRDDVQRFCPADHIDRAYGLKLREVASKGVLVRAITTRVSCSSIDVVRSIPVFYPPIP